MAVGEKSQVTFDVGVRFQVLQSSLKEIQGILNNLKPDSRSYRDLANVFSSMKRELDSLQIQTSKTFGSESQFKTAGKSISKIEDSLERVRLITERINFSELNLNSGQEEQFENIRKQIANVSQEFRQFKEETKTKLFENADFRNFADSINADLVNRSFEEVVKAVRKGTDDVEKEYQKATDRVQRYAAQMNVFDNIRNFRHNFGINEQNLGRELYEQITLDNINFTPNGRNVLFEYLRQNLTLNDTQIQELRNLSLMQIRQTLIDPDFFEPQRRIATRAAGNQVTALAEQTRLNEERTRAQAVNNLLRESEQRIAQQQIESAKQTEQLNQKMREGEKAATDFTRSLSSSSATSAFSNQLKSFRDSLDEVNVRFLNLQRATSQFNSIRMAITNFMGFHQVLNITKNAVREAMNHIKQLDATMNSIAIVTNMTTADLWKQVDAYSAIAQKFGVTIQGAYEVSKIYYQAGYETNDVLTLMNETLKLSKVSGLEYGKATDYMMTA